MSDNRIARQIDFFDAKGCSKDRKSSLQWFRENKYGPWPTYFPSPYWWLTPFSLR